MEDHDVLLDKGPSSESITPNMVFNDSIEEPKVGMIFKTIEDALIHF